MGWSTDAVPSATFRSCFPSSGDRDEVLKAPTRQEEGATPMVDIIKGVVDDVVGKAKEVVGTVAGRND
jgi:hypothetical protein